MHAQEQRYTRDIYGHESWTIVGLALSASMQLQTEQDFTFVNEPLAIRASVRVVGDTASVRLVAPGVESTRLITVRRDKDRVGEVQFTAEANDDSTGKGMYYRVECSLGLNAIVEQIKAADDAEMARLGPPFEWPDRGAPSLGQLPVGTVLELTRDLDIQPGTAQTTFVEESGLMTQAAFWSIRLPFRYAFAEFFNANNGYIRAVHYPAGMRLKVAGVTQREFSSGGHEFIVKFETLGSVEDPITWMKVNGRRSGKSEMVIPQFAALLAPAFKIVEP